MPNATSSLKIALTLGIVIFLYGCLSQSEYRDRLIGAWQGTDGDISWCLTLGADGNAEIINEKWSIDQQLQSKDTVSGYWEVYDGGRLYIFYQNHLNETFISSDGTPLNEPTIQTKKEQNRVVYFIKSITEKKNDLPRANKRLYHRYIPKPAR